ncbi:HdeD family acid-resistance protein [Nitrosomonas sp. HPC101]|uniref:HdeD family acid-resistance protein n=1 Tax=Nitrosomonas sp. HPC101 TaxID=1658667 RepID=UPI00136FF27E|nr:HdeD family acid-resistance protein [Nitrosomonas sp. HPC101]MXS84415.1 HdeD family acid-resistance protein [Nitrosomonas sp. HPC101]
MNTENTGNIANTEEKQLAGIFARNWWLILLRGFFAIIFGFLTWFQPGISLTALVFLFGAYAIADGAIGTWIAIKGRKEHDDWWVLLLWGLLGIVVGILTFLAPSITTLILLFYIAIWAISTGVLEIVAAIRLRKEIKGEWLLILGGLISIAFGVFLIVEPSVGVLAVLWMIAAYAVLFGILLVALALRVRTHNKQSKSS